MNSGAFRVLITGVAGFIGAHLAARHLRDGARVIGVDNLHPFYNPSRKRTNLDLLRAQGGACFEFVEADITDEPAMKSLFERARPDSVVHLAAKAGVRPSLADPVGYAHTNVVGTSVILNCAASLLCSRVLCASSSSVYGNAPRPLSTFAAGTCAV